MMGNYFSKNSLLGFVLFGTTVRRVILISIREVKFVVEKRFADALFSQCYEENRQRLYKYCLVRLDNDTDAADDCVQEAFIVLYDRLKSGEEFANARAFLYRTADNFVKKQWSHKQRERSRTVPLDEARDSEIETDFMPSVPDTFDYDECARRLIRALSQAEQTLYQLRYVEQLSIELVAERMSSTVPAVTMRLSRLRTKVRDTVAQMNLDEGRIT